LVLYNVGNVVSTMRKHCFDRGQDGSDLATVRDWGNRKRAIETARWYRAYGKASPAGKIEMRLSAARALKDRALIEELEAELVALQAAQR